MSQWFFLIAGGVLGTLARYAGSGAVYRMMGERFPYGTLAINLLGCFLIGLFFSLSENRGALSPNARLFLMTGFCGAFTTFSTFMLETHQLLRDGQNFLAFANIAVSILAGFLFFRVGTFLGQVL